MKNKSTIGIILIAALIIGGLYIAGFGFNIAEGSSILSLSQVDLESNFGPLDGRVWVYTFRTGGLSQIMRAEVTPDDVAGELSSGEVPTDSFFMDVYVDRQECRYDVKTSTAKDVATLKLVWNDDKAFPSECASVPSKCPSGSTEVAKYTYKDIGIQTDCYSICSTKEAEMGVFDSPDINSDYAIIVENDGNGEKYSGAFSTLDGGVSGSVGPHVYVEWQGNLDSGRSCPDKDEFRATYVDGQWRTTDENAYQAWLNSYDDVLVARDLSNIDALKTQISNANQKANIALRAVEFRTDAGTGSYELSRSLENAKMVVNLDDQIAFPIITAYVEADWIGIYTPVGEPKIVGTDSSCFATGEDGTIQVDVKNVGDEREEFLVRADCGSVISIDNSRSVLLQPGETKSVFLPISGDVAEKTTESCTVIVEGLAKTVTATQDACVDPQVVCQVGTLSCGEGVVRACNEAGSSWEVIQTCDSSCEVDQAGIPQCVGPTEEKVVCADGTLADDNSLCKEPFNKTGFFVTLILSLVVVGVVGGLLGKVFVFNNGKVVAWIIGGVVGVLAFFAIAGLINVVTGLFT